jgi:DNA gyrase subunit B
MAGGERRTMIDRRTLLSQQAMHVQGICDQVSESLTSPFVLKLGESESDIPTVNQLFDDLLAVGRKGLDIQRYKGLGEMNPDQLWETTMDPEVRTLLQVRIDDSVEADGVFTVLMGDNVEPRRAFIERNALTVKNLDV